MITDPQYWDAESAAKRMDKLEKQVTLILDLAERRRDEIESLRAINSKLADNVVNERILRYAETERCAKIAIDYTDGTTYPFVEMGKAIAALILRRGE